MTTDDTVTIPRELAERVKDALTPQEWSPGCQERIAEALADLKAITDPPPTFHPEVVEVMAASSWERYGDGRWVDSHHAQPKADWRKNIVSALTAARDAGWEMAWADELAALRELVDVAYDDPGHTSDGTLYAYLGDHARTLTKAQADAIREAKAAQR